MKAHVVGAALRERAIVEGGEAAEVARIEYATLLAGENDWVDTCRLITEQDMILKGEQTIPTRLILTIYSMVLWGHETFTCAYPLVKRMPCKASLVFAPALSKPV